jgi:hypothetical protein
MSLGVDFLYLVGEIWLSAALLAYSIIHIQLTSLTT